MSKDKERFVRTRIIPCDGYQPEPTNPIERVKVPNVGSNVKQAKSEIEIVSRNTFDPSSLSPWSETPTQQKIKDILSGMTDLLLYKNKKYGDSAINPKKIFYKGDSTNYPHSLGRQDWKGYVEYRGKASCKRCCRHYRLLYASSCKYGNYFRRLEKVYGLGESYGCKYYCQYNIDSAYGGACFRGCNFEPV